MTDTSRTRTLRRDRLSSRSRHSAARLSRVVAKHLLSFSIIDCAIANLPSRHGARQESCLRPRTPTPASVSLSMVVLVLLVAFVDVRADLPDPSRHRPCTRLSGRCAVSELTWYESAARLALRRFFPFRNNDRRVLALSVLSIATGAAGGVLALTLGAPLLTLLPPWRFILVSAILVAVWFVSLQACVIETNRRRSEPAAQLRS